MTDKMPPLPECARDVVYNESKGYSFSAFTADQMHAYARTHAAAVAAPLVEALERAENTMRNYAAWHGLADKCKRALAAYKEQQ